MTNYKGTNNLGARDSYNYRTLFEGFALNKGSGLVTRSKTGVEDFNKFSSMFYGKYIFESGTILKPKKEFLVERNGFYMFDFVALALDEMLLNYENGISRRKIKIDDRYLSKPKVQAGYVDFESYHSNLRFKFRAIINAYISGKNVAASINSFEDFVSVFLEYFFK